MFKNEYKQQLGSKVLYSTSRLIVVVSETEQKESFQKRNLFIFDQDKNQLGGLQKTKQFAHFGGLQEMFFLILIFNCLLGDCSLKL